jgi:AAA+ ATPase superfamily predicted ATPase
VLPFLDRREESARLTAHLDARGGLAVLYGRRRCGKSRLLTEALRSRSAVYYVGDDRDGALQRAALANEIARLLPGFADVRYPEWEALLGRFWREAPRGCALALDEFPAIAHSDPTLPSVLQKILDRAGTDGPPLVLCGSSQRLMQGVVLDRSAPLFGRSREVLKVEPLRAGWVRQALRLRDDRSAVEAYAAWGGVPRYWELAAAHRRLSAALEALVLSPLGVLHDEPRRLLLDDVRETAQPLSVLALVGAGCHRLSEIAGRLGKPATSLARPLGLLVELGLLRRDLPHGTSLQDSKRTAYRLRDPFLRLWFRFVEPNRSRLEAGLLPVVAREVEAALNQHVAGVWEDLARDSVPAGRWLGHDWNPASSWWGPGLDRRPLEVDVVAESADGSALLLGEAKWQERVDWPREVATLRAKAARLPIAAGRRVHLALWTRRAPRTRPADVECFTPRDVMRVLR